MLILVMNFVPNFIQSLHERVYASNRTNFNVYNISRAKRAGHFVEEIFTEFFF